MDIALTELVSEAVHAKNLELKGSMQAGMIELGVGTQALNGGSVSMHVNFDSQAQMPALKIQGEVRGFLPGNDPAVAPRSAFISLSAQGKSEA